MSLNEAPQLGAEAEERPAWFTAYLESLNIKREEVQAVALENVLSECDDISEVFKNNISTAYRSEAQLKAARQTDREVLNQQLLCTPVLYTAPYVQFPRSFIVAEQAKICSKINDSLTPLNFSSRSLKHWLQHFDILFNCKFITERVARIAIVYNSCSLPLQQQILSMDVGSRAKREDFKFQDFLQILSVLCNSPNHQEQALQQLYAGINQASGDSITIYLEKIRSIAEDAYGLATRWTVNQASLVLQKVVNGLRSKDLAQLTSSFVITLPFNYNLFQDVVVQYEMRLPSHPPAVHTINALKCFKCQEQHLVKDCTVICCIQCAGRHKASQSPTGEIQLQQVPSLQPYYKRPYRVPQEECTASWKCR